MKKSTKLMRDAYNRYLASSLYTLGDCYGSYSVYKDRAFQRCADLYHRLDGNRFRIIGYNCNTFSVGFEFPDPETGVLSFAYITKDYDRFCEIDWD